MKIVVVAGLAESLINFRGALLEALVAAGHDVIACAPDDGDAETVAALQAIGVAFHAIPLSRRGLNPLRDARLLAHLARWLGRVRPDAVLTYTLKPVVYGGLAARLAGVPRRFAMITGLGQAFSGDAPWQRILQAIAMGLYRVSLRAAEAVFFQNPDDEALFAEHGLLGPRTRVVRINGSGVDLARYAHVPVPGEPPIFLLMARLLPEKGILDFVAAAREVKARHPEARFRLLGAFEAGHAAIDPALMATWQAEGVVEYLGSVKDVRPALAAASVFVLPSYYREGVPRSILEAMATGRPIITTDRPGCRETVTDGVNGFLVPARDPEALAAAMTRFIERPEAIAEMGEQSLAIVRDTFDVHAVNAVILEAMGTR